MTDLTPQGMTEPMCECGYPASEHERLCWHDVNGVAMLWQERTEETCDKTESSILRAALERVTAERDALQVAVRNLVTTNARIDAELAALRKNGEKNAIAVGQLITAIGPEIRGDETAVDAIVRVRGELAALRAASLAVLEANDVGIDVNDLDNALRWLRRLLDTAMEADRG